MCMAHSHPKSCFICLNGGNLVICSRCPRVCCDQCIPHAIHQNTLTTSRRALWICPSCHVRQTKHANGGPTPYYVGVIQYAQACVYISRPGVSKRGGYAGGP